MSTNPPTEKSLAVVEDPAAPTMYAGINRGQLELLKRTLAKGTTDDEFALFMNTSQRLRLDPFAKQIYAVKRWDSNTRTEVMATQVAIDGYRAVAESTGEYDGQDGPFWCGDDSVWKEVWTSAKPPAAAKVIVYKKGVARGFVGIASYGSFVQKNKDGGPRATWAVMPDVMLAKCAEAQALRKAFPKQLSGTHTPDEIDDGDAVVDMTKVATALPAGAPTPAVAPTATAPQAQAPSDTWPALLADLAPLVDVAIATAVVDRLTQDGHAGAGAPVAEWAEAHVEAAVGHLLDAATTVRGCNDTLGPWIRAISKHAGASKTSRAALLKAGFEAAYKKRNAELRAQEKGGPAS